MKSFQFSRIPKILFGNGEIARLPGIISSMGSKVILVTGRASFERTSVAATLLNELEKRGISFRIVRIPGEPSPVMIDNAVYELKAWQADLVTAIGGGSVMDAGKAISAMLCVEGTITDYLEDVGTKEHPGRKLPFVAVPTTSGTGCEATKNAVISNTGKDGFKKSLRHDNFVPDIALVDPELTLNCPPEITAASGMDCFTQLTEAYLSTKADVYTEALAREGLKSIKNTLLISYRNGENAEARSGMSFAALTSGICLANAGLGVVHGFASSVGALFDIPHGLLCGTLMAVSNEITVKKLREKRSNPDALRKYADLGRIFLGEENKPDDYYVTGFINFLHELTLDLKLPGLKGYGLDESSIGPICNSTGNKNNPVSLDRDELSEILARRIV